MKNPLTSLKFPHCIYVA